MLSGGSGAIPEPTVKVWMGEGKNRIKMRRKNLNFRPLFFIAFYGPRRTLSSGFFY
jgi:hypothetical protein